MPLSNQHPEEDSFEKGYVIWKLSLPISLFREEGSMLPATKSQFMHNIEDILPNRVTSVSNIDAVLFDATVKSYKSKKKRVF